MEILSLNVSFHVANIIKKTIPYDKSMALFYTLFTCRYLACKYGHSSHANIQIKTKPTKLMIGFEYKSLNK